MRLKVNDNMLEEMNYHLFQVIKILAKDILTNKLNNDSDMRMAYKILKDVNRKDVKLSDISSSALLIELEMLMDDKGMTDYVTKKLN